MIPVPSLDGFRIFREKTKDFLEIQRKGQTGSSLDYTMEYNLNVCLWVSHS